MKHFCLLFALCTVFINLHAQDIIGKKNGEELKTKVLEIGTKEIKYKKADQLDGPIYNIQRSEVMFIKYENGNTDFFDFLAKITLGVDEKDSLLNWYSEGESQKVTYKIQQYRWNKWLTIGEIEGKEIVSFNLKFINKYSFKLTRFIHSDINQFRIEITNNKTSQYASCNKFISTLPSITFHPIKTSKTISLSRETMYEIYSGEGKKLMEGFGKQIDVSSLPKGVYYLNYDNTTGEFLKTEK